MTRNESHSFQLEPASMCVICIGIQVPGSSVDLQVSAAIRPLESRTTSRVHTVKEEICSSYLNEARVKVSEIGEGGEPKTRSG